MVNNRLINCNDNISLKYTIMTEGFCGCRQSLQARAGIVQFGKHTHVFTHNSIVRGLSV